MLLRAKQMTGGADMGAVLKKLGSAVAELDALMKNALVWDERKSRAVLGRANAATDDARHAFRSAKTSARVQKTFLSKLQEALKKEALVYGKTSGGKIDCKVSADDWYTVCDNVHQRWLTDCRQLERDGVVTPLTDSEALALYVTGSSRSGGSFNVSVHLWRRRAHASTPPSAESRGWPVIDNPDWYDTYVTCCVLHVP